MADGRSWWRVMSDDDDEDDEDDVRGLQWKEWTALVDRNKLQ